jgi:DNA ligase 1
VQIHSLLKGNTAMKFLEIAHYFERISRIRSRLEITKLLAELYGKANAQEAQILSYLCLGQLRPVYEGTIFNLAEKSVAKIVAKLLHHPPEEIAKKMRVSGDLGLVVLEQGRWDTTKHLMLTQVYLKLGEIEMKSGTGSQEERTRLLLHLLQAVEPLSACYVIRIILGKLRLGFSDMTLLDSFSWMLTGDKSLHTRIEHAYNICVDIGIIAFILKEKGIHGLDTLTITVGIPIRPAAAERLPSAQAIIDKIGHCVVQPKLDGFRLQIHVSKINNDIHVWFFSRNLLNMSAMFPELIAIFQDAPVKSLIVEGEAISYNEKTGKFVPFQETVKRKRKHDIEYAAFNFPIRLFLFDILYLNEESFLDKGHEERRKALLKLYPVSNKATVSTVDEKTIETTKQLQKYFLEIIQEGLEGVIAKRPHAVYQAGKRNFNWIKLKHESQTYVEDSIDAVVLGYYYGKGKRATFDIGAFLIGVYDKKHDVFQTIAKVGTGLKDADWIDLKKRCDQLQIPSQPPHVVCSKELVPDVWVEPSIICEVIAEEITLSPLHTAGKTTDRQGFALRFPRFVRYRLDKSPQDVTTTNEIQHMYTNQRG